MRLTENCMVYRQLPKPQVYSLLSGRSVVRLLTSRSACTRSLHLIAFKQEVIHNYKSVRLRGLVKSQIDLHLLQSRLQLQYVPHIANKRWTDDTPH